MAWRRNFGVMDLKLNTKKFFLKTRIKFNRYFLDKTVQLQNTVNTKAATVAKAELKSALKGKFDFSAVNIKYLSLQNMYQYILSIWGMSGITGFMQTMFLVTAQRMLTINKKTSFFFDEFVKDLFDSTSTSFSGDLIAFIIFSRCRKASYKKYITTHVKYPSTRGVHCNTKLQLLLNKTTTSNRFRFGYKHFSGRGSTGKITVYSKCARAKHRGITYSRNLNYLTNYLSILYFVRDFPQIKFAAYVTTGSGYFGFIPMVNKMSLYIISFGALYITEFFKPVTRSKFLVRASFCEVLYLVNLNTRVSYIADQNFGRAKFVKSAAVTGKVVGKYAFFDKTPTAVIRLPSTQLKAVTAMQVVLFGAALPIKKKFYKFTRAGYWRTLGYRPRVRGIAKNPVDHPHGGRENTVLWPRTPWGKSTK